MSSDYDAPDPEELRTIEQFAQNDSLFRSTVTFNDFASLRHSSFEGLHGPVGWTSYTYGYMPVVFIDLMYIVQFLFSKDENRVFHSPGLNALNLKRIAQLVCGHMADDAEFHELLWDAFDEEVASTVMAELGLSDFDNEMADPFNGAMGALVEIANLIKRYLINAGYPLVGKSSIYTVYDIKNGILALRLRTYEELKEQYGG